MTTEELLILANTIKNATRIGENNAPRIGSLFVKIIENLGSTLKTFSHPYLLDTTTFLNDITLAEGLYNFGHGFALVVESRDFETNERNGIYQFDYDSMGVRFRRISLAAEGETQEYPDFERELNPDRLDYILSLSEETTTVTDDTFFPLLGKLKVKLSKIVEYLKSKFQSRILHEVSIHYWQTTTPVNTTTGKLWYNAVAKQLKVYFPTPDGTTWKPVTPQNEYLYVFATKRYLWSGADMIMISDSQAGGGGTGDGDMLKSVYDADNDGIADKAMADGNGDVIHETYQPKFEGEFVFDYWGQFPATAEVGEKAWVASSWTAHVYVLGSGGMPMWVDITNSLLENLVYRFGDNSYFFTGTDMQPVTPDMRNYVQQGQLSGYATQEDLSGYVQNQDLDTLATTSDLQAETLARQTADAAKQNKTDNTLETTSKDVVGAINELKARVDESPDALSYPSYSDFVAAFNAMAAGDYNVGQSVLIGTVDVPDIWIYQTAAFSAYTHTTDAQLIEDLATGAHIGYYVFQPLETQKVNLADYYTKAQIDDFLSNYYTATQVDALLDGKVDKNGTARLMLESEVNKLAGIDTGAQVNVIEEIKVNGVTQVPVGKSVDITVRSVYAAEQVAKPANGTTLTLKNATETTVNNTFTNSNSFTVALPEPVAGYVNESILILTLGASAPTITHPAGVVWRGRVPVLTTGLNKEWVFIYEQIYINNAWAIRAKAIQTV